MLSVMVIVVDKTVFLNSSNIVSLTTITFKNNLLKYAILFHVLSRER
jgi:hypothetical protein